MFKGKWESKTTNFDYIFDGPNGMDDYLIERINRYTLEKEYDKIEILLSQIETKHARIPTSKFFGVANVRIISQKEIYINNEHLFKVAWED